LTVIGAEAVESGPPLDGLLYPSQAYCFIRRYRRQQVIRNVPSTEMLHITQQIISEEFRADSISDTEVRAAFRVCEKLRRSLSVLTGVAGFSSILSRALALAKIEAPWLGELQIGPDGSLKLPVELEARVGREEATRGGAVLIRSLLGLLVTFIGHALTLRLVQDVWPKAAFEGSEREEKDSYEKNT
jgi:hypothetical protein